jgi:Cyclin
MLGNKFLDDNTYTNKTWAEVSGISVKEIHIMEVEFLSNMKYNLLCSESEWNDWHIQLSRFCKYFDLASRTQKAQSPRRPQMNLNVPQALPSPPISTNASPPYYSSYSPGHPLTVHTNHSHPHFPPTLPSPAVQLPDFDLRHNGNSRKRSLDDEFQEPPAKRMSWAARSTGPQYDHSIGVLPVPPQNAFNSSNIPRLPIPNLPTPSTLPSNSQQLPTLSSRAMSMVFPPPNRWSQPSYSQPPNPNTRPQTYNIQINPFNQQSRPQSQTPYITTPSNVSPTSAAFPTLSNPQHHTTPQKNVSPSFYLRHRDSPYRPVQRFSTLLAPPPSGAVQNADLGLVQGLGPDQMHYQPLSKDPKQRAGLVPYMQADPYSRENMGAGANYWPPIPQPNFRA